MAIVMVSMMIIVTQINTTRGAAETQVQDVAPNIPTGYPGNQQISSLGTSLIPMIENASQFKSLANGVPYHISPYSSFGYSWGPNTTSIETIILYPPNMSGEIEVDVFATNSTIQHMYFDNITLLGYRA